MTVTDASALLTLYWPYALAALLLVLLLLLLLGRRRGQRVALTRDETELGRRTLARDRPAAAPVPPPALESDLTRLKGVGPRLTAVLAGHGVMSVAQLAALDDAAAADLDASLGTFRGRLQRDRLLEQARLLESGDHAAYEAIFGRTGEGQP